VIRPAVEADVSELVAMIRELADFENLSDQVAITEDDLARTLFGPDAMAHDWVIDDGGGGLAGHALWYRTFSTFLGKTSSGSRTSTCGPRTVAGATPAIC
jgi:hypothetical protein